MKPRMQPLLCPASLRVYSPAIDLAGNELPPVSPSPEVLSDVAEVPAAAQVEGVSLTSTKAEEPEFEEIWRFRRLKPKFEGQDAQPARRHHRRGQRDTASRPSQQNRPHQPAEGSSGDKALSSPEQVQTGTQREQERGQHRHRHRQHRSNEAQNRDRSPVAPQVVANAPAGADASERRANQGSGQTNRDPISIAANAGTSGTRILAGTPVLRVSMATAPSQRAPLPKDRPHR